MKKHDARKLDHKTPTELRRLAVKRIKNGESPEVVARVLNVKRVTVYGWLAHFLTCGWGALNARKGGGRLHKLDRKALQWIFTTISTKNSLQLKFPFALWTGKVVGELIWKHYKVRLSKASVCRFLNQLGLTPQ